MCLALLGARDSMIDQKDTVPSLQGLVWWGTQTKKKQQTSKQKTRKQMTDKINDIITICYEANEMK